MFPLQGGQPASKLYVDDVFSTYLYTGNGSAQTINNGIDLAGKGGSVWIKSRSSAFGHAWFDTVHGVNKLLRTNATNAQITAYTDLVTAFNSNGFSLGADASTSTCNNASGGSYASWTFRKAPKFFDVVTYTGTGTLQNIGHSLGQTPGMIIFKRTDTTSNWIVYHSSLTSAYFLILNGTGGQITSGGTYFNNPTSSQFSVISNANVNALNGTYVAYLFAHDAASDGLIQCGSFTTDGSGNATVNLGWEPQFVQFKRTDSTGNWTISDAMRGMEVGGNGKELYANTSGAEASQNIPRPTATGFTISGYVASAAYIYLAIRRPNKPPTSGTQVFSAGALDLTNNPYVSYTANFPIDLFMEKALALSQSHWVYDRLRGGSVRLYTDTADSETTGSVPSYYNYGFDYQDRVVNKNGGTTSSNYFVRAFRRAPGFFDVVCYTGTGVVRTVTHNLGVVPTLTIIKRRDTTSDWRVTTNFTGFQYLHDPAPFAPNAEFWGYGTPTSTTIPLGINASINASGGTYVAYLFASLPGISKVGSYTGNGTSQTINCGFTTGARFILIKRTDSTGDWYVWDSARGIVAANDPHLSLNTPATEVTTNDSVDPDSSGFIVNQNTATNINVSGASYIFLAIA